MLNSQIIVLGRAAGATMVTKFGQFRLSAAIRHRSQLRTGDRLLLKPMPTTTYWSSAALLLVDGIFLHPGELLDHQDISVFLSVGFVVSVALMAARAGGPSEPDDSRNRRYVEGQRLYVAKCDRMARASLVIRQQRSRAPRIATLGRPAKPVAGSPVTATVYMSAATREIPPMSGGNKQLGHRCRDRCGRPDRSRQHRQRARLHRLAKDRSRQTHRCVFCPRSRGAQRGRRTAPALHPTSA